MAEAHLWPKGPLVAGQALLLSEALGSGVLFAAAMSGAARADWLDTALTRMQQSPASLVPLLRMHGCQACTDITGFGLLGHLGEMLASSPPGTRIALEPGAIPALPGALQLLQQDHASSLAPANAGAWRCWRARCGAPPSPPQLSSNCGSTRRPAAPCWPPCQRNRLPWHWRPCGRPASTGRR
ncbi:AIR synthase-related protein [Synechococcus sp. GFB01]|uniref:AIR synthase-related protein n=1 Tax=Synechococcus sp. GFB01 TaxID=1662190 RepID=UPI001F2CF4F5|nr:AIR synthase-related protein [Synechococcus sp. GFB01]